MSLIALSTHDSLTIEIGKSVVLDAVSMKVRTYDDAVDTPDLIIGVSYPKSGTLGRLAANIDGACFTDNDYLKFTETLQYDVDDDGNMIENEAYDPLFNAAASPTYVYVAMMGLCPVVKGEVVPDRWRKVRDGVAYDLYLVR